MNFTCDICGISKVGQDALKKHILNRHRNAKKIRYACDLPGCGATYDNFRSLQSHKRRHSSGSVQAAAPSGNENNSVNNEIEEDNLSPSQMKSLVAHFLLQNQADEGLSDRGSVNLANNLKNFVSDFSGMQKQKLAEKLRAFGVGDVDSLLAQPEVSEILSAGKIFSPFSSTHKQDKFMREHFNLIEPIPVVFGKKFAKRKVKGKQRLKQVDCVGYYVPFLSSLSSLLLMPEVATDVLHRTFVDPDFLTDIPDAAYCKNDPVLSDPKSLKISCFDDEFTITNPLGVHRQHKVLAFYFVLLNIRPQYRSNLAAIQLLAMCRSADVKRFPAALTILLSDFVNGLNKLRNGIYFEVSNERRFLRGGLVNFAADTLAANGIGCFNEGVGSALL